MSLLDTIDRQARQGGLLHQASPKAKLLAVAMGLAAVIMAQAPLVLVAIATGWLALACIARLPVLRLLAFSLYALVFALLYALATWAGDTVEALVVLLKAGTGAEIVLVAAFSTPSPRLFQAFQGWLPSPLPDALFLTYRSFFLLLDRWYHVRTALRLRSGLSKRHPVRSASNLAQGLGMVFLDAMDRSDGLYQAMLLRGYRGRLAPSEPWRVRPVDGLPLATGALSLAASLVPAIAAPWLLVAFLACLGGRWPWRPC